MYQVLDGDAAIVTTHRSNWWRQCGCYTAVLVLACATAVVVGVEIKAAHELPVDWKVVTAAPVNRPAYWTNAMAQAAITGQDGCSSSMLAPGIWLWAFGDTIRNCPGCGWVHNSGLVLHIDNGTVQDAWYVTDPVTGWARPLVEATTAEQTANVVIWSGAGVYNPVQNASYLWWLGVAPGNAPNLEGVGTLTGTFDSMSTTASSFETNRLMTDMTWTTSVPKTEHVVMSQDGKWMYIFVFRKTAGRQILLARVDASTGFDTSDPLSYSYWGGADWDSTIDSAAVLVPDSDSAQLSVEWNEYLGQWMMLESGFYSTSIYMRTAQSITGPWTDLVKIYDMSPTVPKGSAYCAYWHPELFQNNGQKLVFTHCVASGGDQLPYMVEVELARS